MQDFEHFSLNLRFFLPYFSNLWKNRSFRPHPPPPTPTPRLTRPLLTRNWRSIREQCIKNTTFSPLYCCSHFIMKLSKITFLASSCFYLNFLNPMSLAYSRKHCLHKLSPYLRMIPCWLEHTRHLREPGPYDRG